MDYKTVFLVMLNTKNNFLFNSIILVLLNIIYIIFNYINSKRFFRENEKNPESFLIEKKILFVPNSI